MKKEVDKILNQVIHPETEKGLLDSEMVESIAISDERIAITLLFSRGRDPFAKSLAKQLESRLKQAFPKMKDKIIIDTKESDEGAKKKEPKGTQSVKNVIAVASGKGGVGKSTVTANLAVSLAKMGYKVGVLDADIYGPSQPRMFGKDDFLPVAEQKDGVEMMIPALSYGVKLMSIGFFISPDDALVWRGPMATSALRQMIHQTLWGELDYLLVDLPPGTGDVHLTILQELNIDGAVIVTTPQAVATDDVVRGISMFQSSKLNIPVLGLIGNMAWFTPAELPDNRYYIFGKDGASKLAESKKLTFFGDIPIIQSVMDGGETGKPAAYEDGAIAEYYMNVAKNVVEKAAKK